MSLSQVYDRSMEKKPQEPRSQVRFPQEVWDEMKRLAEQHQRSLNGEIIWALREYIVHQKEKDKENIHANH